MKIIGIIPARLASSRLPNKPLADILGMPMIGHVYKRSKLCEELDEVYVATCDIEIFNYIKSLGGECIMTSDIHERASDRTAEAMLKIEEIENEKIDIVVMIQGDEPMITPKMISASISPLINSEGIKIVNLMSKINSIIEFEDPAEVKVVVDKNNNAIYFSREPIPSRKKGVLDVPMLKQVCIIPFTRDFLIEFNNLPQSSLEIIESIDMNRLIENNIKVKMVFVEEETYSVDTSADLEKVNSFMKTDLLISYYLV